ncbi:tyrosine-type recombinase/integrase [Methylophilaceae bacterium]|nr:tyrosine-type recombinase/integrase [Methylophilaceae bacterium]
MAQSINKLSNLEVQNAVCPKDKNFILLNDGGNLSLRVIKGGNKYWFTRLSINSKKVDRGIGNYPEISLQKAREIRNAYKTLALQGIDPKVEKEKQKFSATNSQSLTFGKMFQQAYDHKSKTWSEGHCKRTSLSFKKYLGSIKDLPLASITDTIVLDILEEVHKQAPATTKKVKELISIVYQFAMEKRIYTGLNPTLTLRNNSLLKAPDPIHHKALDQNDIGHFLYLLDSYNNPINKVFLYVVWNTGLRSNSLRQLRWSWIDKRESAINIPKEFMKTRTPFKCPLTPKALSMIESLRGIDKTYVFLGNKNKPVSDSTPRIAFQKLIAMSIPGGEDISIHGFRTTLNLVATRRTKFSAEVIESQLTHAYAQKIRRVYLGNLDYFDERKELLNWYEDFGAEEKQTFIENNGLDKNKEKVVSGDLF